MLSFFLDYGSDSNILTAGELTLVHDVSMLVTLIITRYMIKYSGSVNITDNSGTTPLSVACDLDVAVILRENGAKKIDV